MSSTQQTYLNFLNQLIPLKSISTDPEHKEDTLKTADKLIEFLKELKFKNVQLLESQGFPAVYGELITDPTKPTLLIYGHYDVQSPGNLKEWKSEPFSVHEEGDYLLGRGVSDNKGQIAIWLTALKEILDVEARHAWPLQFNLKILVEGEEEMGSIHLKEIIEANKDLLKADIALIQDETQPNETQPAMHTSLRGLVYLQIGITAHSHDLHSGVYGGRAVNSANVLSTILSKLKDPQTNHVLIPDFYKDVLSEKERGDKNSPPRLGGAGPKAGVVEEKPTQQNSLSLHEPNFTPEEAATIRPTLDINGLWSGNTQDGISQTIIPASAHVKISCRLVANQKPEVIKKLVIDFIETEFKQLNLPGVKLEIKQLSGLTTPVNVDTNHPLIQKMDHCLTEVFGNKPVYQKSGGTIGAASLLAETFETPLILTGFPLDNCRMHAPNEQVHLPTMLKGVEVIKKFLT